MNEAVSTKRELIDRIVLHQREIMACGVRRLGIFGSFVRNEAREESDIDFLVEINPAEKTLKNFIALADILESITGRNVEIVTPQSLSKYIGPYILKEVEYVPFAA